MDMQGPCCGVQVPVPPIRRPALSRGPSQLFPDLLGGELGVVEAHLKRGGDPNLRGEDGRSLVHAVCVMNQLEALGELVKHGADVNARDSSGWTALHHAALLAAEEVCKTLLRHAADPNTRDYDGRTPLHVAVEFEQDKIMELLLLHGGFKYAVDSRGCVPMDLVSGPARRAAERRMESLLLREQEWFRAAQHGEVGTLQVLLADTPELARVVDKSKWSALHHAALMDKPEAVSALLRLGAEPNAQNDRGVTPLHLAAEWDNEEVVKILVAGGASTVARDSHGRTPLDYTTQRSGKVVWSGASSTTSSTDGQGAGGTGDCVSLLPSELDAGTGAPPQEPVVHRSSPAPAKPALQSGAGRMKPTKRVTVQFDLDGDGPEPDQSSRSQSPFDGSPGCRPGPEQPIPEDQPAEPPSLVASAVEAVLLGGEHPPACRGPRVAEGSPHTWHCVSELGSVASAAGFSCPDVTLLGRDGPGGVGRRSPAPSPAPSEAYGSSLAWANAGSAPHTESCHGAPLQSGEPLTSVHEAVGGSGSAGFCPRKFQIAGAPLDPVVGLFRNNSGCDGTCCCCLEAMASEEADQEWEVDREQVKKEVLVGTGVTASVFRGSWRGTTVALKEVDWPTAAMTARAVQAFHRELRVLVKLRHPNLVLFMGASTKTRPLVLLCEFCEGGPLYHYVHNLPQLQLSWKQKLKMCLDAAMGLNFLHTCTPAVVHRDVKSLNLLLVQPIEDEHDKPFLKVADFGLSRIRSTEDIHMTMSAGTYHWMAPEVLSGRMYDEKVDIYSFAIVMYEVICRRMPFEETGLKPLAIALQVAQGGRPDLALVPDGCPPDMVILMERSWQAVPAERPPFGEIIDDLRRIQVEVGR
mmetsp:Transcript_8119/g.17635  ORF Transcript_8119/g.17635 Transcript_8119/m.17635 type:complete len:862 (+) Transcript_8119:82-2667(+)